MKPFIWDYEDALVNRDAAVTWILCCKKGLMHKDTAKIIALYVFNGFEYANGSLKFLYKNEGGIIRALSWENGISNARLFRYKGEFLRLMRLILNCVYDDKKLYGDEGIWDLNSEEPTTHQRLQILEFVSKIKLPLHFDVCWDVCWEQHKCFNNDVINCNTIGDVINFMKAHYSYDDGRMYQYFGNGNMILKIPCDGPVSICHRYKF